MKLEEIEKMTQQYLKDTEYTHADSEDGFRMGVRIALEAVKKWASRGGTQFLTSDGQLRHYIACEDIETYCTVEERKG